MLGVLLGAVAAAAALVDVSKPDPRVHVRWRSDVGLEERAALERRYGLMSGAPIEGTTWRYGLRDLSRENIAALIRDPAVADTGYIDRSKLTAPPREVVVRFNRPRLFEWGNPSRLLQPQA